jgi:hypothetical protein
MVATVAMLQISISLCTTNIRGRVWRKRGKDYGRRMEERGERRSIKG